MQKINRRDYLVLMGAGTAGVVGGGLDGLTHFDNAAESSAQAKFVPCPSSERPGFWRPRIEWPNLSEDRLVKLVFWGLMGFIRGENKCEIGFHLEDKDNREHRLTIGVSTPQNVIDPIFPDVNQNAELSLTANRAVAGLFGYFQPPGALNSRRDLTHEKDFRWIIDFDSPYLYGKHFKCLEGQTTPIRNSLQKKSDVLKPKLVLQEGLFYTLRRTASTFRAQTKKGDYVSHLGRVADMMAVNLYLEAPATVTIKVDSVSREVAAPKTIYFINSCANKGHRCPEEFNNLEDKKLRNDFYMNYQAFDYKKDTIEGTKEYELFLHDRHARRSDSIPSEAYAISAFLRKQLSLGGDDDHDDTSDESPCAATGYGGDQSGP